MACRYFFLCLKVMTILNLAFISGLSGCQRESGVIRIGVIAPLSGDTAADYGIPTVEGARMAAKDLNDAGGLEVDGRNYKVELVIENDQDKAEVAVAVAKKLINQQNVVALVGLPLSRNAIPVANVAEAARVPMISCKSTNPQTTAGKKYVFRAIFIDPFQGWALGRFARDELNVVRAGVLFDVASAYNKGLAETFKQTFEGIGGRVVAFETYTTDRNNDFIIQLERIRESQAQVLFLPNYSKEVLLQAQQARKMGITATLLGGDAWDPTLFEEHPEFENSYFSEVWHPDIVTENARAFLESFRRTHGCDPKPYVPLTYDSVGMVLRAIRNQGRVDTEAIRVGLYAMGAYHGISGDIEYRHNGDPVRSAVILQIKGAKTILRNQVFPK